MTQKKGMESKVNSNGSIRLLQIGMGQDWRLCPKTYNQGTLWFIGRSILGIIFLCVMNYPSLTLLLGTIWNRNEGMIDSEGNQNVPFKIGHRSFGFTRHWEPSNNSKNIV